MWPEVSDIEKVRICNPVTDLYLVGQGGFVELVPEGDRDHCDLLSTDPEPRHNGLLRVFRVCDDRNGSWRVQSPQPGHHAIMEEPPSSAIGNEKDIVHSKDASPASQQQALRE